MSARERRLQRKAAKGGDHSQGQNVNQQEDGPSTPLTEDSAGSLATHQGGQKARTSVPVLQPDSVIHGLGKPLFLASQISVPLAQMKRGKRGKAKKLKAKYADQDEDERSIRMELLGHKPKKGGVCFCLCFCFCFAFACACAVCNPSLQLILRGDAWSIWCE
jgi:hypothetical protein